MVKGMAEILNVFNFLKEFNELSNPVITEIDKQKWNLSFIDIPVIDEIKSVFLGHEMDENEYFEVKRPTLLSCPKPHESLIEWIQNDWKKLSIETIDVKESISRESTDEEGKLVYLDEFFNEDPSRVEVFEDWIKSRNGWRKSELPKEKGLRLYNDLFQLYSEMKKDSESVELILGDGHIRWYTSDRVLDHPVLLQKVQLYFDAHVPLFKISCEEKKSDLYTPMLRVIPTINQKMLSDIILDIDQGEYDIANYEDTSALFKRIINVIDISGTYVDEATPINNTAKIHSAPMLFLRKRTLGFSNFIESVIEDISEKAETPLPDFFGTMTGVYKDKPQVEIVEKNWNYNGIDKDVLLTLPANNEQLRIIKYLDKYGAVLVQGPPGTGKTHTIANLIGHLLSQGSSVLVTSHTEKALSVLKEKVYKDKYNSEVNLQSLCISLLSSTSQKKEMDEAINEIASKSTSLDLHTSEEKIRRLEQNREDLTRESRNLTEELIRVRALEYKDLIYDNKTISPIDAAKFLNKGFGQYDYIVGKSNNDEIAFPLSFDELEYIYSSNDQVSREEEMLLTQDYPDLESLFTPEEYTEIVEETKELKNRVKEADKLKEVELTLDILAKEELLNRSKRLSNKLNGSSNLEFEIIKKTVEDPTYPRLWDDPINRINEIEKNYESYQKIKLNDDFDIKEALINRSSLSLIKDIIDSGKEKPIGFLAKTDWKKVKDAIIVNGKNIETHNEFTKAYELISYEIEKKEIFRQVEKLLLGIADLDSSMLEDFENKTRQYKERIIEALSWYKTDCESYFDEINEKIILLSGEKFIGISSIADIEIVNSSLTKVYDLIELDLNNERLTVLNNKVHEYQKMLALFAATNPYIQDLLVAVQNADQELYGVKYNELRSLIQKSEIVSSRKSLIARIRNISPRLAEEVDKREGKHSGNKTPDNFADAWKHFQLRNQIERLDEVDPEKIQKKLEDNTNALLENARSLAYEKAWYEKIKNQTDKQNQALQGWRSTIKQIGKGTGKNAPMLRAKARELMPLCQTAIPVWIMPLNRVVENFDPRNNKFDVIIIDEASQANILALSALYLAKKVIIVGDDEQVSPDSFGVKTEEVNALVAQHLERIPNNHLYNGLTSLYDMAKSSGFKPLMLSEHFRCLPEIIEFSNSLSYNGRIKPLRDASNVLITPSVVEYRVPNGNKNSKKVNEAEVAHIVSIIQAMIEQEEYKDQTIGVISMLGSEQSAEIERILQSIIDPVIYEERRIQCGTPPQFQGDERDIIILSLVDSPNEKGGPLRLLSEDGNNDKYRKRYNVAVSRARNQLWVVHSLNPEIDLKPDDLRLKLIKYAMNPQKDQEGLLALSESPFEMNVMKYLLDRSYKIIPQYKVGAYRIDMVLQYQDKKVALECDGERFHTIDNLENDMARQAILERLGWRFIRIRGSEYYRNPETTMLNVLSYLEKEGIYPTFEQSEDLSTENSFLIASLKNKASIYRGEIQEAPKFTYESNDAITEVLVACDSSEAIEEIEIVNPIVSSLEENDYQEEIINETRTDDLEESTSEAYNAQMVEEMSSIIEAKTITSEHTDTNNVDGSKPLFDFRNKKGPVKTIVSSKKSINESSDKGLSKPKFDFRNKK